jgi:hypothetical protein
MLPKPDELQELHKRIRLLRVYLANLNSPELTDLVIFCLPSLPLRCGKHWNCSKTRSRNEGSDDRKAVDSPVYVKDGNLVVRQIQCIEDAVDFLEQWPLDKRGMVFEMTQEALYSAYDARLPMVAARSAFAEWARSAGVLEDVSIAPVWMTGHEVGSGGVPL